MRQLNLSSGHTRLQIKKYRNICTKVNETLRTHILVNFYKIIMKYVKF
jgi:hypothetical protein